VFFERILQDVRRAPPRRVAVAAAAGVSLLEGLLQARDQGIAQPLFFGDAPALLAQAEQAGLALSPGEVEHQASPQQALQAAVGSVRQGRCGVLLKGKVPTPDFLRAVLNREQGLRGPGLLTHMAAFEMDSLARPLFLTDSGLNPYPSPEQKVMILGEGIRFMHRMGYARPRVAVLSSSEQPDPRNPASRDAATLKQAAAGDALGAADVDGPYALDLAVSTAAAELKGIVSPVAGRADLLICPDVVAGNILGKSMLYLAQARAAGVILGATAPVVMLSRADTAEAKLRSLALAIAFDLAGQA
jgi:phosphate butyryltransferase